MALLLVSVVASASSATTIWDESIDGSLSTDRFNTTAFGPLGAGSNDLIGTTVSGISKFFTITIAPGSELSAVIVESWASEDDLGFLGVITGNFFSVDPTSPDVTQILGYVHYGEGDVGQDILPNMGQGPGSQGFAAPLGSGDYSFWVRQGGADPATWDLNFVVVPEPGTAILLGLGLAGLSTRRRQSRTQGRGLGRTVAVLSTTCVLVSASVTQASLIWDEAIDGDLSDDYANPTTLFVSAGANDVIFTTVGGAPQDREYFTFSVAAGYELSAVYLEGFVTSPETNLGFIGVANGSSVPTPPDAPDPTVLAGYALVGLTDLTTNILPTIGTGGGSQGFSGALGAGSYSWWAQETGPSTDDWRLRFNVTAVPEPGTALLMGLGLAGLASRRR